MTQAIPVLCCAATRVAAGLAAGIVVADAMAAKQRGRREVDSATGQLALSLALRAVGAPATPVGRCENGAPDAPAGYRLSLSHATPVAVALAAPERCFVAIGVDIERAGRVPDRALHLLASDMELSELSDVPGWLNATRLLAAKEAAYKASASARHLRFVPRSLWVDPLDSRTARVRDPEGDGSRMLIVSTRRAGPWWLALSVAVRPVCSGG